MAESISKQTQSIERQLQSVKSVDWPAPVRWPKPPTPAAGDCDPLPKESADALINSAAAREGIAVTLVRQVVQRESGLKPCAVSPKGALGLMQLMPATAEEMGVRDPFDPEDNVRGGVKYLKLLLERYAGDVAKTLAAYNAGPGRVDRVDGVPDIPETRRYVVDILTSLGSLSRP